MSTRGYVMLSYSWDHQELVIKIRDGLKEKGFRVWMDIDEMDGFIYSAMSKGVKEAELVLACLSAKYEKSENCRSEGACIKQFKKPFIPLMMESAYSQDDWVATIFGGHLYIKFYENFDDAFQKLLKRLQKYPNLNPQQANESTGLNVTLLPPAPQVGSPQATATSSKASDFELSDIDFNQMLNIMADWSDKYGKLTMLKVFLCDFLDVINISILDGATHPTQLFGTFKGAGLAGPSNMGLLAELTELCGMKGVEEKIKKKLGEKFKGFKNVTKPRPISEYRKTLLKFGQVVSIRNKERIGNLYDFTTRQMEDQWVLIFELEKANILTEEQKSSVITVLERNDMAREANALKGIDSLTSL